MLWKELDKNDTTIYKGLAILMIVIHNFLHRFPMPKENEMTFDVARFEGFLSILVNEPSGSLRALFSFFGHFGVQIFIFLSAYGLTKKYLMGEDKYFYFIKSRLIKLYPSFLLAIIAYVLYIGVIVRMYNGSGIAGSTAFLLENYQHLLLKLTLMWNFIPNEGFALVGPWWFMSMIFQFYLIFPFIFKAYKHYGNKALLIITGVCFLLMFLSGGTLFNVSIFFMVFAHLPVFCLGIYLSANKAIKINNIFLIIAIILYALGNYYIEFWLFSHINFCIILLFLFYKVVPLIKRTVLINRLVMFFGTISMPLFLVNGFLRAPLEKFAHQLNNELYSLILCAVFLSIATISAYILLHVETYLRKSFWTNA
jgi:peptidoglycan/LPS O-acetylase OafA/YrhL